MGQESFEFMRQKQVVSAEETLQGNNSDHPEIDLPECQQDVLNESWNPEEAMIEYKARNAEVARRLSAVDQQLNSVHDETHNLEEKEIQTLITLRDSLKQEKIKAAANYPGDWTGLLRERMQDPTTKERFITQRKTAMFFLNSSPSSSRQGDPKNHEFHYQDQIDNYNERVEAIFKLTHVGTAADSKKERRNIGQNYIGEPGIIFIDGEHRGKKLTSRQFNIAEAHEKGHGLRDYRSSFEKTEISSVIDSDALLILTDEQRYLELTGQKESSFTPEYVSKAEEIIERMAQFKNYFGMGAQDVFEKDHLDYIREHYVQDTGFDNGVTDLLRCVTPETEEMFLDVINKYPI